MSKKRGEVMIIKRILFCGIYAAVGCDEKCDKAWGRNSRPKKTIK